MPADIKLLSPSLFKPCPTWAQKAPQSQQPQSSTGHTASTLCNTHTKQSPRSVPGAANPLHPSASFSSNNNNRAALPLLRAGACVSPGRSCKAPAPGEPGSGACCNTPALTALLLSGAAGAALPGHTWLAQPGARCSAQFSSKVSACAGNCPCSVLGVSGCSGCSPYPLPLVDAK